MDAIIAIMVAIYFALKVKSTKAKIVRPPVGTNDTFYRDENAFMEVYNAIMKTDKKG